MSSSVFRTSLDFRTSAIVTLRPLQIQGEKQLRIFPFLVNPSDMLDGVAFDFELGGTNGTSEWRYSQVNPHVILGMVAPHKPFLTEIAAVAPYFIRPGRRRWIEADPGGPLSSGLY